MQALTILKQASAKTKTNNPTQNETKQYLSKIYLIKAAKLKTLRSIAEENGVSIQTISRVKKRFGLAKEVKPWSNKELLLLAEHYHSGLKIGSLLPGRSYSSITHKAHKLGLTRNCNFYFRRYAVNENFFKNWTKESAYVFGLLCSDGTVASDYRYISFHINKKDIELLDIIKKATESTHPIKRYGEYVELKISNKKLTLQVENLGCTPQKSLTLEFPKIPDEFLNHFVRGYFDGDGSILLNKPNTIKISMIGTEKFLQPLQNKLYFRLGLQKHKLSINEKMHVLQYYGDDARKFCLWLYNDSDGLLLKRKYDRYVNHIRLRLLNGRN